MARGAPRIDHRQKAAAALVQARADEAAAKLDHARTVEKIVGQLKQLFPRERRRQDLYFPGRGRRAAKSVESEVAEE